MGVNSFLKTVVLKQITTLWGLNPNCSILAIIKSTVYTPNPRLLQAFAEHIKTSIEHEPESHGPHLIQSSCSIAWSSSSLNPSITWTFTTISYIITWRLNKIITKYLTPQIKVWKPTYHSSFLFFKYKRKIKKFSLS